MSKKLTFEIDFEVNTQTIKGTAETVRKEFSSKLVQDINTVTLELNRQIDVLELYRKTGEMATDEVVKGFSEIEQQLKSLPIATRAVISTQSRLFDAQKKLSDSSANLGGNLKGTNQTLIDFSRVIQDAPFGILGVANNIDPLVGSFQRLSKEGGGARNALSALVAGLTGPAGLAIAVSAITSLMIAFGDDIVEFFTKPTLDAESAADAFTKSLTEQADLINKLSGNKKGSIEATKTELNTVQEQIKALKEFNAQTEKQISLAGVDRTQAFGGTGEESQATKDAKQQAEVQREIIKVLSERAKILQGEIAGQELFNKLAGEQRKILEAINQEQKTKAELPKENLRIDTEDFEALVDQQINLQLAGFEKEKEIEQARLVGIEEQLLFEENAKAKSLERQLEATRKKTAEEIALEKYKQSAIISIQENAFEASRNIADALEATGLISAKQAFNINKAIGIADATINTYAAVTAALRSPLPPPFPQIDAGIRLASGLAQVAKISAMQFNPKGGGSGSSKAGASGASAVQGFTTTTAQPTTSTNISRDIDNRLQATEPKFTIVNKIDDAGLNSFVEKGGIERRKRETELVSD